MQDKLDVRPPKLSGGQQQRVIDRTRRIITLGDGAVAKDDSSL